MEQLVGVQVGLSLIKISLPNFIYRQAIGKQNRWINYMKNEQTAEKTKSYIVFCVNQVHSDLRESYQNLVN
jgi:hypothetical protein